MKRKWWKTILFLIILVIITLFVRLFFLQSNGSLIVTKGEYFQKAMIDNQGIYKLQHFDINEVYTKFLSGAMLLFGNYEMAGVYLNIALQLIAIIILYYAIGFVANEYTSFLVATVISILPFYSGKVYEISEYNLLMLLYVIGLFILAVISRGVYMFVLKKKNIDQDNVVMEESTLEEQKGVITLDDIIKENDALVKEDKPEQKEVQQEISEKKEDVEVVPPGMKEIILDEEEKKKKVKFIENPLPVPKRREHKEMDYAIELNDGNDDFDIKDVSGMDFFDIE